MHSWKSITHRVSGFSTWYRFIALKQFLSGVAHYHSSCCPSALPQAWALNLWFFLLMHLPAPDTGTCRFCRTRLSPVLGSAHPLSASLRDFSPCGQLCPPRLCFLLIFSAQSVLLCFAQPLLSSIYVFAFAIFSSTCSQKDWRGANWIRHH